MPDPSFWPVIAAVGLPLIGWGVAHGSVLLGVSGAIVLILGLFGWALEPSAEEGH